jgi:hypothetical protein
MGAEQSKTVSTSVNNQSKVQFYEERDNFLKTHMPLFLRSEYCKVDETEWVHSTLFLIAFHSFLTAKNVKIPSSVHAVNPSLMNIYFNHLDPSTSIYATGAHCASVLVGVNIVKWPGSIKTDIRAPVYLTNVN